MTRIPNFWVDKGITRTDLRHGCCGCGSCAIVCPQKAIAMCFDSEGFLYPRVDERKCSNCSLCVRTCPLLNCRGTPNRTDSVYASFSKNRSVISCCSSGGVVTELSLRVVRGGGTVFGVRYDESCSKAVYDSANSQDQVFRFSSSKYVQSEKNEVFLQVKETLETKKGDLVLFTGCPCDLAALRLFLKHDYDNLITCELFCAGVTSELVLEEYKVLSEKKNKSKLVGLNMRSKANGWYVSTLEELFQNGKVLYQPFYGSLLGHAFASFVRPSCLKCLFRNQNSSSDFRVGDFWGIKPSDPFWNKEGVSCVIAATEKAESFLNTSGDDLYLYRVEDLSLLQNNRSLFSNRSKNFEKKRNSFSRTLVEKGLKRACMKTDRVSFFLKRVIPMKMQPIIKSIYHRFVDRR